MKRSLLFSLLMLMFATAWAEKVQVSVKMNATSRTMTLTPKDGGDAIDAGQPDSYLYTFEAEPGLYVLEGFNASGASNGTMEVVLEDGSALTIFTLKAQASNSGWTLGEDFTIDAKVFSRQGEERVITTATDGSTVTFLAQSGDTYNLWYIPNETHKEEGYLTGYKSGTVTYNVTAKTAIPMGYTCTLTVPADANVVVGSKTAHFVPFTAETPVSVSENGSNKVYTYTLAQSQKYNYRISAEGKLTKAVLFTMPSEDYSIEVSAGDLEGDPLQIDRDPQSNGGFNVCDLFTNADERGCIEMKSGETHQLVTLRTWEIVNTVTDNYFFEPDYHFTVVDENGQPSTDVVEVSADGVVTAKKAGTAIVLVTYDAINSTGQLGGPVFGAIWPENTGAVIVNVDAQDAGIMPNMFINGDLNNVNDKQSGASIDAEMDILYYLGDYAEYTFAPAGVTSVAVAAPTIGANAASYNGFASVAANADGSYTLKLSEGRNIVRLTSATGSVYQVVRAKKCGVSVANVTNPGEDAAPGDQVTVTISGLYHPAHKLAGVYNMAASIQYNDMDGNTLASKTNQYKFTSTDAARTVTVTIPDDCDEIYTLTSGVIKSSGYGDPYGGHRTITYTVGKNPNFTAVQHTAYFGALPDIKVYEPKDYDLAVLTFEDSDYKGEGNMLDNKDWSSLIDSPQYGGNLLYGSSTYWWWDEGNTNLFAENADMFWSGGTAVSNYVSNTYENGGYKTQLEAYNPEEGGKGGHNGSDNFLVCYGYYDDYSYGDGRPIISFDGGTGIIDHAYINLGTYGIHSAKLGDGFSSAATESDYVDVVAEALDEAGDPAGASTTIRVVDGTNVMMEWTKWDLSVLGECAQVRFNISSTLCGDYGLNFPAYFLLDDIAVRKAKSDDPGTSAIESIVTEPIQNNIIYNLQGIRVNDMSQPGIYIVNGQKVLKR